MPVTIELEIQGFNGIASYLNKTEAMIHNGVVQFAREAKDQFHLHIKNNTKRRGSTGTLAGAIRVEVHKISDYETLAGAGNIDVLNKEAPYWYVVNYGAKFTGGKFIPGMGKTRPVLFDDGFADSSQRNSGSARMGRFKRISSSEPMPSAIRPMHYIERTRSWAIQYWEKYWATKI